MDNVTTTILTRDSSLINTIFYANFEINHSQPLSLPFYPYAPAFEALEIKQPPPSLILRPYYFLSIYSYISLRINLELCKTLYLKDANLERAAREAIQKSNYSNHVHQKKQDKGS
jgi:hypothetical protein